ncbi:uncharacterized protein GGS25DRAFT_524114 [Hypoxylon fragiforme]|uniref:uncharacterized protein n=1 Tax=Hypoxylon fragiforme TaxID=63214 RepID=UPI0020C6C699|nr:uncharacterized protein GGS25DRAFT_524114 [Hypoxylon fragiforme]KAI2606447.1 hypothetical protein GGS25DRAFT_524114 [Hypoxylon fragiforme]
MGAGMGISKFGRYRPWFFLGTAAFAISFGLYSRLDENSSAAYWAGAQCIGAAGVASAALWVVAIPAAIFNSRDNELLVRIEDSNVRERLANGGAYALATGGFMSSLNQNPALKAVMKSIYVDSLKRCWQVAIGFSLLGLVVGMTIKQVALRTDLQTELGIEKDDEKIKDETREGGDEPPGFDTVIFSGNDNDGGDQTEGQITVTKDLDVVKGSESPA